MTDAEVEAFVIKFAAAWAARDGEKFLELWHSDGVLRTPFVARPVAGSELGKLNATFRRSRLRTWCGSCSIGPRAVTW
jgi:hypothetical protein